jgi:hypothetical protein
MEPMVRRWRVNVIIALGILAIALIIFVPPRWLFVGAFLIVVFLLRKHIIAGFRAIIGWFRTKDFPRP